MKKDTKEWLIKSGQSGVNVLTHPDGNPIECIYKAPVVLPHPNLHGQMVVKVTLCDSRCPMFDLTGKAFGKLTLHCTKRELHVYLDDNQANQLTIV